MLHQLFYDVVDAATVSFATSQQASQLLAKNIHEFRRI